jgi:hypothetical protein
MMKTISFVLVALSFAALGCKKESVDCAKAIANSMEVSKADMEKRPGMDDKTMQKMKDIGLQHCKGDKWPEDALKCMSDAKTEADAQACYGKLSREQQDNMNQAAMDMAKSASGATGSAGAGDIGSGSAAPK